VASARALAGRYAEHRFGVLFAALLLAIAGHALLGRVLPVANPLDWLLGVAVLAVVLSARHGRLRRILDVLALAFVVTRLAEPWLDQPLLRVVGQTSLALACLLAAGVALRRALAAGAVDAEHIFAALDAYLLLGMAFGVLYWLLEIAIPGSFTSGSTAFTPARAMYFSFVTQATLGYGDVVPLREESQGVVVVHAISGQIYLAVLVARLVSLYSAQPRR
jgi:hypothetical protein